MQELKSGGYSLYRKMLEEDKAQHFICAYMAVLGGQFLVLPLESAAVVFSLGLLKEFWDFWKGTGFCWYDITANTLGLVFAFLWLKIAL